MAIAAFNDYVYTSSDSGNTWTQHTETGKQEFECIAGSANNSVLYAGAYFNYIYVSKDYGSTWTNVTVDPVNVGAFGAYKSLASSHDGSVVYAVVSGVGLYKSVDFGQTWTNITIPIATRSINTEIGYISTSANGSFIAATSIQAKTPYFSNDSGLTWYTTDSAYLQYFTYPLQQIVVSADGTKILVSSEVSTNGVEYGLLFGSQDGGLTWQNFTNVPNAHWFAVTMSYDGSLYVAAIFYGSSYTTYKGSIYTSTNQGTTWTEQNAGYREWYSLSCSSNGSVILAGPLNDYMYVSLNSGVNWTRSL